MLLAAWIGKVSSMAGWSYGRVIIIQYIVDREKEKISCCWQHELVKLAAWQHGRTAG